MQICVVGVGYWGPNLVRNLLRQKAVDRVFVCDLDMDKLTKIQEAYPTVEIEPEYSKILQNSDIDAIAIATPTSSHYALAKLALESDKHLLLEKPMTSSSAEAQELIDIAHHRGLTFMLDHTLIYTGAVEKMRELLDDGTIGDITYFDSTRINLGLFRHDQNVVWDLAPHDLSIMLYLMRERPIAVLATGIDHLNNGREDIAYITLYFAENTIAHFHLSWISPIKVRKIIVGGSKKMMVYDDVESDEKIKVYDKGIELITREDIDDPSIEYRTGDTHTPALENKEALYTEMAHFIECIQTGTESKTSAKSGLWIIKVLEATQSSIKSGKKVFL